MKLILLIMLLIFSTVVSSAVVAPTPKSFILSKISWNGPAYLHSQFGSYFTGLVGKSVDNLEIKLKTDMINKELFLAGYFDSSLSTEFINSPNGTVLNLNFTINQITHFSFKGNEIFNSIELKNKLYEKIKNELGKVDVEQLKILLVEAYEEVGFFGASTNVSFLDGKNQLGQKVRNYYFEINEGSKLKIVKLDFRGNLNFTELELRELFEKHATPISKEGNYDKFYAESFSNLIKKQYLSRGFVYAEVSRPRITYDENGDVELEYLINEKNQVTLSKINFENLPVEFVDEVKSSLTNKEGSPINVIELENDFKKVVLTMQSKGFYFVSISNLNTESILNYEKINSTVVLNISLNLERKVCFNDVIINGNVETKKIVIEREIRLTKEELLTPVKIEEIRQRLSGLGLFSSLRITPYMIYEERKNSDCARTNIIIQVKEKEFGQGEFSPGYRTDLGAKAALGVTINNIQGMNRTLSIKTQVNQRFNNDSLDAERKTQDKKLLEYSAKVSLIEPYLFYNVLNSQIEFEATSSWQRKRFFSFDADIFKISPQISKNFSNSFSTSLRYQLERIIQFGATDVRDNDNFTIGSITPSITYDRRDDQINPRRGYYLNISSEWANNYFGSMKDSSFEVNYIKVVNRNRFYYPLGNFVFATSLSAGYEQNYATSFYIPRIKVFRLDGYDEIRGFEDGEINRIPNGTSISDVEVKKTAYFVAFKFEPRYNISDNMQVDVFFDAGRVFVDKFQPLNLRTSVGAGLKFLTPVGSLDFDYGFKLKRLSYPDNVRDATGRFHLSIGFF
jgi:outer membrane protein insertion porin family